MELTFEALAATDLAGKARAFGSLVMAGMKPEEASEITGFVVGEAAFRQRPAPTQPRSARSDDAPHGEAAFRQRPAPTSPGQGTKIIGNSG